MPYKPEQDPGLNRFELGPVSGRIFELRNALRVAADFDETETDSASDKKSEPPVRPTLFTQKTETPIKPVVNSAGQPKQQVSRIEEARSYIDRVRESEDTIDNNDVLEAENTLEDAA